MGAAGREWVTAQRRWDTLAAKLADFLCRRCGPVERAGRKAQSVCCRRPDIESELRATTLRLTFIVGVSSPVSLVKSTGRILPTCKIDR